MVPVEKIGPKRLVVGAHYGTGEFILTMSGFTYEGWKNLFTFTVLFMPLGQILATLAMISLAWHAWIGVRDIWMDYIKPVGLRIFLLVLTLLWLVGSVVYFVHILWRN
jgi:succinate dehydrogenase / fumarate reductase membrane anchor subunit